MSKWVEEELEPGLRVSYGLKEVLASTKSKWQHVDLVDLQPFGRVLMIDGLVQSCQSDEFVYHESLVHPAMLMHPNPKTVYIGGGGEGSTAREVLRHKSVEKCMMVDIDGTGAYFVRRARTGLRAPCCSHGGHSASMVVRFRPDSYCFEEVGFSFNVFSINFLS